MTLTKRISLYGVIVGLVSVLTFNVALAQTGTATQNTIAPADIPKELVSLAQDLGCQTKVQCAEKFNADIEQGIALAQKYDIYTPEQKKVAATFKAEVLERLRGVSQENFEQEILVLANKILKEKPALAKTMSLTKQTVNAAETIINTVKDAGVDIRICQKSPEDLSREQLIACVKAGNNLSGKGTAVGEYIPKENAKAGEAEKMLALETSLLAGEYPELGKVSVKQAGQICLKSGSESITDCDKIAQRFFGNEGVQQLQQARQQTIRVKEYYTEGISKMELVTPNGQRIIGKNAIKNVCDAAFEDSDLGLARACGDFAVKNGYATQNEIEDGLKLLETFSQKAQGVNFDDCRFNPQSCRDFLPDDFRSQFDSQFEIFKIMSESIGFDPARCENSSDSDIGKRCLEGAKKALSQVEAIAQKSPEARRIVDEIKLHIAEGERMTKRLDEFNQGSVLGKNTGPGGCRGPEECFKYCSQPGNSAECISFGAKRQIFNQNTAVQKFNLVNEQLNKPQGFDYRYFPDTPDTFGQLEQSQPDQRFNQYPPPYFYQPQQLVGPGPECMAAISSGDFVKAKTACASVTTNYPKPIAEPFPVCPTYSIPSPCPEGQMRQQVSDAKGCMAYGACNIIENYKPIDTLTPKPCLAGQYWDGRSCVAQPTTQCLSGQWWDSSTQSCKSGTVPTVGSCDYSTQYWKASTSQCQPRANCYDTANSDYNSQECQGVRGATAPVSSGCGSFASQATCQANPGCGWANGACGGNVTTYTACPSGQYWYFPSGGGAGYCKATSATDCAYGQYWDGTACVSSSTDTTYSTGWTNKAWKFKDGATQSSSILNRTDSEYTAHISTVYNDCSSKYFTGWKPGGGDQSNWREFGVPICSDMAPAPGTLPYQNTSSSGSCPSGYHSHGDSGGYCINDQENYSGTCYNSAGTATITCPQQSYPPSTCTSGQYWDGTACVANPTTSSTDMSSACAQAGGAWNVSTNYCQMPTSTSSACPSDQYWNGTACQSNTTTNTTTTTTTSGSSSCTSGQYWDGSACVTTSTSTSEPTPTSDPATMCAQSGGTWTGGACQMSKNISDQRAYYSYYQKQSGSLLGQVIGAFSDLFR